MPIFHQTPIRRPNAPVAHQNLADEKRLDEEALLPRVRELSQQHASSPVAPVVPKLALSACSRGGNGGGDGIVGLCRDIALGMFIGMILTSMLTFSGTSPVPILRDAETIRNVDEAVQLKVLSVRTHDSIVEELDNIQYVKERLTKILSERQKIVDEKRTQFGALNHEFHNLTEHLGIGVFCGDCIWDGKITCKTRLNFMAEKYRVTGMKAKIGIMNDGRCVAEKGS